MIKILLLWISGGLWWLSNMVLKPKVLSCDKVFQIEVKKGKFNHETYLATKKTKFTIQSDYGYDLSCELLEPAIPTGAKEVEGSSVQANTSGKKIAILCHGFTYTKYGCLIYAEIFLKLGFTVLIYDHRNHGLSGKAYTSMGYFEKFDLKKMVDWCYNTFGSDCYIVTHGESMGAATVLLHLGIDNRVKCTIADCGYSDLKQLLKHQLRAYYHLPLFLIPVESLITFLRAGFWYREVSPIQIVSQTEVPILFIHGKKDCFVPTYMSKQMYNCKRDKKAIYLVAKARHSESCYFNRAGYEKRVREFLNKVYPKEAE